MIETHRRPTDWTALELDGQTAQGHRDAPGDPSSSEGAGGSEAQEPQALPGLGEGMGGDSRAAPSDGQGGSRVEVPAGSPAIVEPAPLHAEPELSFDEQRELNIANNNALMQSLGLADAGKALTTSVNARKPSPTAKVANTATRVSPRVSSAPATRPSPHPTHLHPSRSVSTPSTTTTSTTANPAAPSSGVAPPGDSSSSTLDPAVPPGVDVSKSDTPNGVSSRPPTPSPAASNAASSRPPSGADFEGNISPNGADGLEPQPLTVARDVALAPAASTSSESNKSKEVDDGGEGMEVDPAAEVTTFHVASTEGIPGDEGGVCAPESNAMLVDTSFDDDMGLRAAMGLPPPATAPSAAPSDAYPAWVNTAIEYFKGLSRYSHWQELLNEWLQFEIRLKHPDGRVSVKFP